MRDFVYANYYSINPNFLELADEKGLSMDSDVKETDCLQPTKLVGNFDYLEGIFPGYKSIVKSSNTRFYKVFDIGNTGLDWSNATSENTSSFLSQKQEASDYDWCLASGWSFLDEDFDIEILQRYQEFGFSRPIDFVTTLAAMKSRTVFQQNEKQHEWERNGQRTTITCDMQGDMQIEQSSTKSPLVLSPFGGFIPYLPVNNKKLRTYFHGESSLMAICLKYIEQSGKTKEYFGNNYEYLKGISSTQKQQLGPYGNAGDFDVSNLVFVYEWLYKNDIENIRGNSKHGLNQNPHTNPHGDTYMFYVNDNGVLEVYEGVRGNQPAHMVFTLEDAKEIVIGLLRNAMNGIGRTGILELNELLELIMKGGDYVETLVRKY